MMKDYKWLESVMGKHDLSFYDVTCCLYEYFVSEIDRMHENDEVEPHAEKLFQAIVADLEPFVTGREE